MFTQSPLSTKARFQALAYRLTPHIISPKRQAQAHQLAPTVKTIYPGIYFVGGHHFVDLWRDLCTCREHRIEKIQPCRHRLALWLAEGVELDDPAPTAYLEQIGFQMPAIIGWYATIPTWHTGAKLPALARWLGDESWKVLNTGEFVRRSAEELYYLTPFYELRHEHLL